MLNEGYRNIQLTDVYARTVEPEIQRLPRQIYLWSSSFLQSCYYFDPLVRSPFSIQAMASHGVARHAPVGAPPRYPPRRPLSLVAAMPAGAGIGAPTSATFSMGHRTCPVSIAHSDCETQPPLRRTSRGFRDTIVAWYASRIARHLAARAPGQMADRRDGFC